MATYGILGTGGGLCQGKQGFQFCSILDGETSLPCATLGVIGQVAPRHQINEMLLKILIGLYLILVSVDSVTTYIGIRHLGFVELERSLVLFDYYGLTIGMIVSTAFCFSIAWLLWKVRRFSKMAAYLGLSMLTLAALVASVNNSILILTS